MLYKFPASVGFMNCAGSAIEYAEASRALPKHVRFSRESGTGAIVVQVSTSKTGKHGHAKCHFVAIDIFTGKKLDELLPSSHNVDVPHVSRVDYQLLDITEDDYVNLLTSQGGTKDDLMLPEDPALVKMMKDGFEAGKDQIVTVLCAMGEEQICAVKEVGGAC